jgi:hypothetical protein
LSSTPLPGAFVPPAPARTVDGMTTEQKTKATPVVSAVLDDGSILETVYDPVAHGTQLCVALGDAWRIQPEAEIRGRPVTAYSPNNNLIRHSVVVFPSEPMEYGSDADLIAQVKSFIHRYVDVSPVFENIASYYVLLSWVYDAFAELPYLRVRGDYGSGKTRFLLTVGSLCYKPIFASGASTVSPLFRILDAFQGTLLLDESDFRVSDDKAEVVKILNNGNARGFPVLRSEVNAKKEYDPRAYAVYGPKIIATRGVFEDNALESRCITEDLGMRPMREDIPVSLPAEFKMEALELRNKLLRYRLRHRHTVGNLKTSLEKGIEPRLTQVFAPLLSLIQDETVAKELQDLVKASNQQLVMDRGMEAEGHVLEVLYALLAGENAGAISLREITTAFLERFGSEYEGKIGTRWMGSILRGRLQLKPRKSHGVYVLPATEYPKVRRLLERYGIGQENEVG